MLWRDELATRERQSSRARVLLGVGVVARQGVEGGGGARLLLDGFVVIVVPARRDQPVNTSKR